jgi:hypothetical protein
MQVMFTRWAMNPKGRTLVSVNPSDVERTEHYSDAYQAATDEAFPAATKIIMTYKQEYLVQGTASEVLAKLNSAERL